MDVLGPIVLVVNILLLVGGWILFQQAKSELTSRAAQIPVLTELRELHKSIAALIERLRLEADQASAQLEARCTQARELLMALERKLEQLHAEAPGESGHPRSEEPPAHSGTQSRHTAVYALADQGLPPSEIARRSGLSAGEVELILGMRRRDASHPGAGE
ncbi:MAG: hypothetical protein ACP5VE_11250 [Chthonomonadales bacterium]